MTWRTYIIHSFNIIVKDKCGEPVSHGESVLNVDVEPRSFGKSFQSKKRTSCPKRSTAAQQRHSSCKCCLYKLPWSTNFKNSEPKWFHMWFKWMAFPPCLSGVQWEIIPKTLCSFQPKRSATCSNHLLSQTLTCLVFFFLFFPAIEKLKSEAPFKWSGKVLSAVEPEVKLFLQKPQVAVVSDTSLSLLLSVVYNTT